MDGILMVAKTMDGVAKVNDTVTKVTQTTDQLLDSMHGFSKAVGWFYASASQDTGANGILRNVLKMTNTDIAVANTLWKLFELAGMFILIGWFLVELNKTSLQMITDSRIQQVAVPFLKLIAGLMLLQYGKDIVGGILGLGNAFVDDMLGNGSLWGDTNAQGIQPILEKLKDNSFFDNVGALLPALLYWVVSLFAQLLVVYQAITRKINIVLYTGLTPLALGDVYQLDQSNAVRYLKKLLANVLWGGVMVAVLKIGTSIVAGNQLSTNIGDATIGVFYCLLVPLAEAGVIASSKQVIYDALGC